MADLGSILSVIIAVGLLLVLSIVTARFRSRLIRRPYEPPAHPAVDDTLGAAHDTIDEIERARVRSMLMRR